MSRLIRFLAIVIALIAFTGSTARAEETPRDVPVVTRTLVLPSLPSDYKTRDIGWLRVSYPGSVEERIDPIVREATDLKEGLVIALGQDVLQKVDIRVARSPEDMTRLAPEGVPPPEYAVGVAYPAVKLVLLSLQTPRTYEAPDLDEVFRHELVHVALSDALAGKHVPLWFNEGLAVHLSGERAAKRAKTLWDATLSKTLMPLADLDRGFPSEPYEVNIAYAQSADFVRFLLRDGDRARFASLIERVRNGATFERAMEDAYGTDVRKLEYQWREDVAKRYAFNPFLAGGAIVWAGVIALMIAAYVRRRRHAKAKLDEWQKEDEAIDRAIAAAKAETELPVHEGVVAKTSLPMVEHDGRWYTLH